MQQHGEGRSRNAAQVLAMNKALEKKVTSIEQANARERKLSWKKALFRTSTSKPPHTWQVSL